MTDFQSEQLDFDRSGNRTRDLKAIILLFFGFYQKLLSSYVKSSYKKIIKERVAIVFLHRLY